MVRMAGKVRVPEALLIFTEGRSFSLAGRLLMMVWLPVPTKARTVEPPSPVDVLARLRLPSKLTVPPDRVMVEAPVMNRVPDTVRVVPAERVCVIVQGVALLKVTLFRVWLPVIVVFPPKTTLELLVVTSMVPVM